MTSPEPCENCATLVLVDEWLASPHPEWARVVSSRQVETPLGEGTATVATVAATPRLYEVTALVLSGTRGPVDTYQFGSLHTPARCREARAARQEGR